MQMTYAFCVSFARSEMARAVRGVAAVAALGVPWLQHPKAKGSENTCEQKCSAPLVFGSIELSI